MTCDRVALRGNLDPAAPYAPPEAIRPDIDPDQVAAMIAAVAELSPAYHR